MLDKFKEHPIYFFFAIILIVIPVCYGLFHFIINEFYISKDKYLKEVQNQEKLISKNEYDKLNKSYTKSLNEVDEQSKKLKATIKDLEFKNNKINNLMVELKLKEEKVNDLEKKINLINNKLKLKNKNINLELKAIEYMDDYVKNYSNIDRGIKYICSSKLQDYANEHNLKVMKANSILDAIDSLSYQLPINNVFKVFVLKEKNKVNYYRSIIACIK